jgi:hypothetical protein
MMKLMIDSDARPEGHLARMGSIGKRTDVWRYHFELASFPTPANRSFTNTTQAPTNTTMKDAMWNSTASEGLGIQVSNSSGFQARCDFRVQIVNDSSFQELIGQNRDY